MVLLVKKKWSMFLRSVFPFCLPSVPTDVISERTATMLVCRNHRLCCFLKSPSVSHASVHVYIPVTQDCSYRFHNEIYFSGTYWKHYQRKINAVEKTHSW